MTSSPRPNFIELPARDVERSKANLESAFAAVVAAGGRIVKPMFGFPGGRRGRLRRPI